MMKIVLLTVALIGLSLTAMIGFAKDGGHSSSNNSTGANSAAAMVKPNWGRTQQNIDKHNASTAKTKAMGKLTPDKVESGGENIRRVK
jgi:hypothetical protein